jgi:hypothetical protein
MDVEPSARLGEAGLTTHAAIDEHLTLAQGCAQSVGLIELAYKTDAALGPAVQLEEVAEARGAVALQIHRTSG